MEKISVTFDLYFSFFRIKLTDAALFKSKMINEKGKNFFNANDIYVPVKHFLNILLKSKSTFKNCNK